jgi:hypothetical protein
LCPHCGNTTPHRVLATHGGKYWSYTIDDYEEFDLDLLYSLVACGTCDGMSLYGTLFGDEPSYSKAERLWPPPGTLDAVVPREVSGPYEEACRVKCSSPPAYAVLVRRALEALCDQQGARHGTLQERLTDLARRNILPAVLAEMTDELRTLGNAGAHPKELQLKKGHSEVIDDFFRAVIEYVYVAPHRLAEYKRRANVTQQDGHRAEAQEHLNGEVGQ